MLPKKIQLKTGEMLTIREAQKEDAAAFIAYLNQVVGETDFLTIGKGEFIMTQREEEEILEEYKSATNKIFLVAELDGNIAGILNVDASSKPRQRHMGELGITVRKEYWGKGVGAGLMQSMIEWAKQLGVIRKLNLTVQANNEAAIALYEKCGFEKEGLVKRDAYINGEFYDAYVMGMEID